MIEMWKRIQMTHEYVGAYASFQSECFKPLKINYDFFLFYFADIGKFIPMYVKKNSFDKTMFMQKCETKNEKLRKKTWMVRNHLNTFDKLHN